MLMRKTALATLAAVLALGSTTLAACSGSQVNGSESGGKVTISMLVDNVDWTVKSANALADAFNASHPNITVEIEAKPGGTDGDNLIKTKLSTGEMNDLFQYNTGSLLQALNPATQLVPVTSESFMTSVQDSFVQTVTVDGQAYGVPFGQATGGGILYSKEVYQKLGLQIPKTWKEFMANNATIKEAGIDPVVQTYGSTWTAQILVLSDFHNVLAADPQWADEYTAGKAKFSQEPAIKGFERLQEIYDAGYLNKDFASTKDVQGLQMLVDGTAAQYPMLTSTVANLTSMGEGATDKVGFFAQPGEDASSNGITLWTPSAIYIPKTTEGSTLEAAKEFLSWMVTPEACDIQNSAVSPTGPYMVKGCVLPDDVPAAVSDLQKYVDAGQESLALEFLSPVKGPNLEKIAVEVGSGMTSAKDGAARYDEDVKKQAQQLGLEGW